ncbi:BRCA2-interacting transcriptional repressor EMSY [Gonioctena quinquepunctata]|nr:BRCA2-interacting transcriptional repressor EMSY [Gonioctena quinquepunctata]
MAVNIEKQYCENELSIINEYLSWTMWPLLLDMTKEESIQNLRNLELEAYSYLVSALRAQGYLSSDKKKLLKDTGYVLNITQERHKAEVRRAINDEKLNTIAYHVTGHTESLDEWAQEGRRLVPLLPRTAPQTVFSAVADEAAEHASQCNTHLPSPFNTERKRSIVTQMQPSVGSENCKMMPFRIPDLPKADESKKRKLSSGTENSSLAQHLLSPKFSKIQQLYRQRTKQKMKEAIKKNEKEHMELVQQPRLIQPIQQTGICSTPPTQFVNQKVNVLQNISLQPIKEESVEQEQERKDLSIAEPLEQFPTIPVCSNENHAPSMRHKFIPNLKPNSSITIKNTSPQPAGPSTEIQKSIKVCAGKKSITKTVNSGQKLIVVSNAQTVPSSSILQRTLQIPFVKNVSIKNLEKFKIVTSNSTPTTLNLTNVINSSMNSAKHKVVAVKTNPTTKKVIPLSQLQVLNSKGSIKVLPLGGKIVGKAVSGPSSPLFIVNNTQIAKSSLSSQVVATSKVQSGDGSKLRATMNEPSGGITISSNGENGKSSVLEDILKASGVISDECTADDYDTKIEEFHIPQNRNKDIEDENDQIKIITEDEIKTNEIQNLEYAIVDVKGERGPTYIKDNLLYDKVNGISDETIESEEPSERETELDYIKNEVTCEDIPNDSELEISKFSDITESY